MRLCTSSLDIVLCTNFRSRLLGLSNRQPIGPRAAVWLFPCRCIHTFGMSEPLSLIYFDSSLNVIGRQVCAKPWRVYGSPAAQTVMEMAQKTEKELQAIELEVQTLIELSGGAKNFYERWIKTCVENAAQKNIEG